MSAAAATLFDRIWDAHVVQRSEGGRDLIFIDRHVLQETTCAPAFEGLRRHMPNRLSGVRQVTFHVESFTKSLNGILLHARKLEHAVDCYIAGAGIGWELVPQEGIDAQFCISDRVHCTAKANPILA
jgi:homoaconitase/3-isopropylmalate dehydratase large subunit